MNLLVQPSVSVTRPPVVSELSNVLTVVVPMAHTRRLFAMASFTTSAVD